MSDREDDGLGEQTENKYVCDVDGCGESFPLAMQLGLHKRKAHGIESPRAEKNRAHNERRKKRAGGGESDRSPRSRRKQAIAGTLRELADLADDARGRDSSLLPEHLSDVIRRDADKIATTVAALAERVNPVAWFVDTTMGPAGVLTLVVGMSGVGRWVLRFWRRQLEQRQVEQSDEEIREVEDQPEFQGVGVIA